MDFNVGEVAWVTDSPTEYAWSEKIRRGFCPSWGASLTYRRLDYVQFVTLSAPTLDAPGQVSPKYHIYTDQAVAWLQIDDSLPRYKGSQSGG